MSQDEKRRIVFPEPEGKRLALVIGVDRAPTADDPLLHNKLNAIKDAEDIARVLEDPHCGFTLLQAPFLGEAAMSANVKSAILDLARHRDPDYFLLLYFAGHGYPVRARGDIVDIYLVTHDFREQVAKEDENFHLSMRWIRDKLYLSKDEDTDKAAGKVLLIFDCCKAGNFGRGGEDPYLEELREYINTYFGAPSQKSGFPPGLLRQALASTGHGENAGEQDGHGKMTGYLLDVLSGEVKETLDLQDYGKINLWLVRNYLQRVMPEAQKPALSGDDAGKLCVLAQYEERAQEIRQHERLIVHERPSTYIPFGQPEDFQVRSNELDVVTEALLERSIDGLAGTQGSIVGLLGMGGIGKSYLALTLAYRYKDENRFPGGIFWLSVTKKPGAPVNAKLDQADVQWLLATLCENSQYRPPDDDVTHPDNEKRRANHICRYLAQYPDALLILDNVDDIHLLLKEDYLPYFAGEGLRCAILYTSRYPAPLYVKPYRVEKLTEEGALALLMAHRPEELRLIQADPLGPLAEEARAICNYVDRLPLALMLLRDLLQDDQLTLGHLREELVKRGALEITSVGEDILKAHLFETFKQSWERVRTAEARQLFQLAASFPEAIHIPLWVLGVVSGLAGRQALEPLGKARQELRRWSLIEVSPDGETITIHPLIREFGQRLNKNDSQYPSLQTRAQKALIDEFAQIDNLERRARAKGYWSCLDDLHVALSYARSLRPDEEKVQLLERIAYWLARDSNLLGETDLWPREIPALFYQQLSNRMFEEEFQLAGEAPATPWIRQLNQVGAGDQMLMQELRHPNEVMSVAFAPDGYKVLTACVDGIARIWDAISGRVLQEFVGHNADVMRAVFSPDGELVATCSRDNTACIYESGSGRLLHTLRRHSAGIQSIAFSPDGKYVATASDDHTVLVWNVASGEMDFFLAGHREPVADVAFAPDGTSLVTCALDGKVYLWDIEQEQIVETVLEAADALRSVSFSPQGDFILIGCTEGVLLWDVQQKRIRQKFATEYHEKGYYITQVACSPDGAYIAACSSGNMAQVWQVGTERLWGTFWHRDMLNGVAFSADGARIATASFDYTACVWTLPGQPVATSHPGPAADFGAMRFSGDGSWLIAATKESTWQVWDVEREQQVFDAPVPVDKRYKITGSVAISGDGSLVCIGFFNTVVFWNQRQNTIQPFISDEVSVRRRFNQASGIALSPDGRFIASGTTDEAVRVWDVRKGRIVRLLQGHQGDITAIAYAPDGRRIVTGSTDGTARIWETEGYTRQAILSGHLGEVTVLCISPDGKLVATGALDGAVYLWSLVRGELVGTIKRNLQRITSLTFSPDSRFLVSCDLLGQVLFWSLRQEAGTLTPVLAGWYTAPQEIGAVHWGEPRRVILADTGGLDGRPHLYRLALEGDWGFEATQP